MPMRGGAVGQVSAVPARRRAALPTAAAWWRPLVVEILLASITKPDAENLWNFFFLGFRKGVVEQQGPSPLCPARGVPVRIPIASRKTYAAVHFFDQRLASQFLRPALLLHCHTIANQGFR
jgi:hypothetical protein